ncbi:Serine/threonine-protein kinase tel-1 [Tolypocladium capitatum]|uniref:Serine/threonine-protein kinase Tel1 n=1 Tax=Tolypocladium capitatum TaxID=45235 RepID=A0A2K3Q914_9HYPO|nr:Serine/threonine-protein kinase tel-1 [Tolypocladium capitatum]
MASSHMSTVRNLARDIKSGSLKDREKAVDDLTHLLKNRAVNLTALEDKSYHEIFEAIFNLVLSEKPVFYDKKKTQAKRNGAASRLSKCAAAVRVAASRGVAKLGRKTLLALIDHITQVLPGPNDDFVTPLLQDYVKALAEVLARPSHVEFLSRKDGAPWVGCVDFLLDIAVYILPSEAHSSVVAPSRDSPAPGTSTPWSTGKSSASTPQSQKRTNQSDGGPLRDALEGLHHLVQAANAPILRQSKDITDLALRVLGMKTLSLGSMQTACFSILNTTFAAAQADDFTFSNVLVKNLLPLMSYWWRADKVSQDELIKALRNEISKTIFLTHLHIENLAVNTWDTAVRSDVENLIDPLWLEYSKRSDAFRLQLDDVTFASSSLPQDSLRLDLFGLRHHNAEGEGSWALVQNMALLEAILLRPQKRLPHSGDDNVEQPRKKRRVREDSSRLRLKLKSRDLGIQMTALQLVPFLVASNVSAVDEMRELLVNLVACASNKNATTASWAMVACARYATDCSSLHHNANTLSCASLPDVREGQLDIWRQLWHIAARSLSLPATSRASCLLLHVILEAGILPHHTLSEDINNFVTTADVNGPAILCDTSLSLMSHLFHERNARLPSASQATNSHIIRWVFLKWNPDELGYSSFQAIHVRPLDFVNLLRICCGAQPLSWNDRQVVSGTALGEAWKVQREIFQFNEYLLLLAHKRHGSDPDDAGHLLTTNKPLPLADTSNFYVSKKLVLELFYPKVEELVDLCNSWTKKSSEGGSQISLERFQSLLLACIIGAMLLPQVSDLNTSQSSAVEPTLGDLADRSLAIALDSVEPAAFIDLVLRLLRPCIPDLNTASLGRLHSENIGLLRLVAKISSSLESRQTGQDSTNLDSMELDDEFESQSSRATTTSTPGPIPRHNTQMSTSPRAFYTDTKLRLALLRALHNDANQIGLVPDSWLDGLLSMPDDDLLSCQCLLIDMSNSDLVISPENALRLIQRLGAIISDSEYQCCEVALTACIEAIDGLHQIWLNDNQDLSEAVGDLYNYFVKVCLTSNLFSPKAQMSMARLLFTILSADPAYGTNLGLDSCRTSLLYILSSGTMKVKCFVADRIAGVFELYILMLHDEVFVDVLDSLPANPEDAAGIAFRLLVLSKLACRWPTLLRRCIYHIFETPGKIAQATEYATWCLADIASELSLDSPKDLFLLFSRQLLYTWMENDSLQDIPYSIFGFDQLGDLLRAAQAETMGLALMRGQEAASSDLARLIALSEAQLIQGNFSTTLSYCMIYGDAFGESVKVRGEDRIKKQLGSKLYIESIYIDFVDIVALFFDLIDQEDSLERVFRRHPDLSYAADNLEATKHIAHSPAKLPPNQQPMFRAKYVIHNLFRLCQGTEFQFHDLWTPALVVSIARRLLSSVHPALGSLHACSVLRKVRLVICLAGPVALESYCLEMLLNSIRAFIVDSECADDALGMSQYLLAGGSPYLTQTPSFLAGYALSTLASLRVFLESSQSSTTQESQFKATMSKAQNFHEWFSKYLAEYESSAFHNDIQRSSFQSITQSAAHIRSSGNAEKDTFEGKLLLDILEDGASEQGLLNEASRELALGLLCSDFTIPTAVLDDIVESDDDAILHAGAVWKSCEAQSLSQNYLSWAGRVVGRSFSASGDIPKGILRESRLSHYEKIAPGPNGSAMGLLCLLQDLTTHQDSVVAGLSEAALRSAVSQAVLQEDEPLVVACQRSLSESLFHASQWGSYRSPPSEMPTVSALEDAQTIWAEDIASQAWLPQLSVHLAKSVPESILLSVLPPILAKVKGFAEKSFPFVVHLVLYFQLELQQAMKRQLSAAIKRWLEAKAGAAKDNVKLLINTILYLRTQEYPKESSIEDRLHWLDIDYTVAASAASLCGMYKTALLFGELVSSEGTRASRRSSASRESDINDTLLTIFENIDDPDTYYGLPEEASLAKVLARVEYEKEGSKSLAFRGAQYDSHLRLRHPEAETDAQALVGALGTLGLSGLSHSVLQTQQNQGASNSSLGTTFSTARRLEMWNLPAPAAIDHHTVAVYRAYQSIHQATGLAVVRSAVYDGFSRIMKSMTGTRVNATELRSRLAALAALTELDDVLNVTDAAEVDSILQKFQRRSQWMRSGMYDDVSQILSCRETTASMLSQHAVCLVKLPMASMRRMQVESMLMSSGIYRYHQATQESLNISTALNKLIPVCEDLNLHVDAAIKIEVANSLWDHGEMSTSIRMLQGIDKDSSLGKQTIPVSRSDLLSKIGHKVSIARLEKPRDIQKTYLEPALKELKRDSATTKEVGAVYHQFATFCDEQLQDADGLEDLARLQSLKEGKSEEVADLKVLISSTKDTQLKARYSHVLSKERQWLDLDEQELRRVEQTRSEFVRLSLENYLLSLATSDEYNNDALRFTALWLERSTEDVTNKAVQRCLSSVPTRKFANLMNQLTSRLQNQDNAFQKLLLDFVYNICVDHPYHGMYQIWSGTKAKAQQKDEVAVLRVKATEKVAQRLAANKSVAEIWLSVDKTSKYYHGLAMDRNSSKYKSGAKIPLKDSGAGHNLVNCLAKYRLPPPTMHIEVSATKDYSRVPIISKLEPTMTIASGVSAPKIITAVGSNGKKYKQLVKGGHDDLRQDAIMEQVFAAVSSLLKLHRSTQQRNLGIRTYKVLPLTASSGLIEFVPNTIPLHEFLMPAHERYYPRDLKGSQCRKEIFNVQNRTVESRISTYRKVTERFHPVMRYFFMEYFVDPDEWFTKRLAYTRSTAAISMLGHMLGLGDRHGHNILLDTKTGEAVHIDLGVAFEAGRILPVPELVPFRLTRDIVDGMGITKTEGVFRRCCEFTLDALREEQYSIMTILDVLRYDPLYTWSISPLRLAKLQKARQEDDAGAEEPDQSEAEAKRGKKAAGHFNEPSEAARALEVVRKKLSKTLSVTATVNDLINQATDERNLAVLYSGWAAYA